MDKYYLKFLSIILQADITVYDFDKKFKNLKKRKNIKYISCNPNKTEIKEAKLYKVGDLNMYVVHDEVFADVYMQVNSGKFSFYIDNQKYRVAHLKIHISLQHTLEKYICSLSLNHKLILVDDNVKNLKIVKRF